MHNLPGGHADFADFEHLVSELEVLASGMFLREPLKRLWQRLDGYRLSILNDEGDAIRRTNRRHTALPGADC